MPKEPIKSPTPSLERVAYGVAEAAEAIGIGETEMRRILNAREIKSFRIGKRRLVRKSDLVQYVDALWERENQQLPRGMAA